MPHRTRDISVPTVRTSILATAILLLGVGSPAASQERACDSGECEKVRTWIQGRSGPIEATVLRSAEAAFFQGDIKVDEIDDPTTLMPGSVDGAHSAIRPNRVWPGGVVPYVINSALPDKSRITSAIDHFHSRTNLQFVLRTSETNYIEFVTGDGCSSFVGRRGGRQTVDLHSNCRVGETIHEIGHAVGLWHEQSRHDRDRYIVIYKQNIEPGEEYNFEKYPDGDGADHGTYDYNSIMHYPSWAFNRCGYTQAGTICDTIRKVGQEVITGQRNGLSDGDIAALAMLYRTSPPTFTPIPTVTPNPRDDHGNSPSTATLVSPNSTTAGVIEQPGDLDVFRVVLPSAGRLTAYTTGSTDTYGSLLDGSGAVLESNDDHTERNFRLERDVPAGSYFVEVRHYSASSGTGDYVLRVEFAPVTAQSGALQVIIEPAAARSAGARWRRNGTAAWRTSGSTETGILVGSHAVEFQTISGWSTPSNAIVTVTANQTTTITRSYGSISGPRLVIAATTGTGNPVITASLDNPSGIPIAGVQLDLIPIGMNIDHTTHFGVRPDCSVNSGINKTGTSFAFLPFGCGSSVGASDCSGIRVIVLALDNVDPIPHGAELFQCRATAERSQYTVNCDNLGASSPGGEPIDVDCTPFSGNGGVGPDRNGDGIVDDFELLDYIDLWVRGNIDDFALLDAIDSWARR